MRILIEHPEDLGSTKNGVPASIWQLVEIRRLQDLNSAMVSVAGHQCQFEVDYSKPTRLCSDIPGISDFGRSVGPRSTPTTGTLDLYRAAGMSMTTES